MKQTEAVIRPAQKADEKAMLALWNSSVAASEVVYSPLDDLHRLEVPGAAAFVAEDAGDVIGWIHGVAQAGAATGYLTVLFVAPAYRRKGIGTALLRALEAHFAAQGVQVLACSGNNPVRLGWRVPGTPGHDHNNAPGVDEGSAGYPFLLASGLEVRLHEVAMYRDLSGYEWPEKMDEIRERLLAEGIAVGVYDGKRPLEFDGMCDRVGSDYWRNVLRQELAAWETGAPCADETLWVDETPPAGPRPLLLATHGNQIVGFTGPVDKQRSGRGWFTGICVDPDYGRRSIGALLFHMLMRAFVEEGAAFTTLFTGAENHAQQIYLRAGLSVVRTFAVMAKPLASGAAYNQTHF